LRKSISRKKIKISKKDEDGKRGEEKGGILFLT